MPPICAELLRLNQLVQEGFQQRHQVLVSEFHENIKSVRETLERSEKRVGQLETEVHRLQEDFKLKVNEGLFDDGWAVLDGCQRESTSGRKRVSVSTMTDAAEM